MSETTLRTVRLPSAETVPALGLGTWQLAEDPGRRADEIAALRLGLDLGMTLIDTAEMYGEGAPAQVALAWVLQKPGIIAIPRSGSPAHVRDNRAALDIRLTEQDLAQLDRVFTPPTAKRPLEML